jgi:hypothetical protein
MQLAPNVKALRALLKKSDPVALELRELVPMTTLRRHLRGEAPSAEWMTRYFIAFGMSPAQWLTDSQKKAEVKFLRPLLSALENREEEEAAQRDGYVHAGSMVTVNGATAGVVAPTRVMAPARDGQ